jgi:hypothetical protein
MQTFQYAELEEWSWRGRKLPVELQGALLVVFAHPGQLQ